MALILLETIRRCREDGQAVATISSRETRAALLAMGYHERDVRELDVRMALRGLVLAARRP